MIVGSHHFGHVVRQHIMIERHGGAELLTSWQPGSREREEGRCRQDTPFEDIPPVVYFLQRGPTS
jgi:hypothetical protein